MVIFLYYESELAIVTVVFAIKWNSIFRSNWKRKKKHLLTITSYPETSFLIACVASVSVRVRGNITQLLPLWAVTMCRTHCKVPQDAFQCLLLLLCVLQQKKKYQTKSELGWISTALGSGLVLPDKRGEQQQLAIEPKNELASNVLQRTFEIFATL